MSRYPRLEIEGGVTGGSVTVKLNGVDLSDVIHGIEIRMRGGEQHEVILHCQAFVPNLAFLVPKLADWIQEPQKVGGDRLIRGRIHFHGEEE